MLPIKDTPLDTAFSSFFSPCNVTNGLTSAGDVSSDFCKLKLQCIRPILYSNILNMFIDQFQLSITFIDIDNCFIPSARFKTR